MSSVRMCDKCETVFSENVDGWQTATLSTIEYDADGVQRTVPMRQDLCPDCAVGKPKQKRTELEERIASLEKENDRLDKLQAQIDAVGSSGAK